MQRVVVRHLTGSKANQVEEFPLAYFKEIVIGREPSCSLKYDSDRDDLVGRKHARISQDASDPNRFTITDLDSRNGTFVNKQRLTGTTSISPGDLIQFGAGGPEFKFDLEPRPQADMRATSEAGSPSATPPTRTGASSIPPTRYGEAAPSFPASMAVSPHAHSTVGKVTVERMIAETRSDSRRKMILLGAGFLVLLAAVAGYLIYHNISSRDQLASEMMAAAPMPANVIAKNNTSAVVYIEAGWELIYTQTGEKVYHEYFPNEIPTLKKRIIANAGDYIPVYIRFPDGSIEPSLTTNPKTVIGNGFNRPIVGKLAGSGFVAGSEGYILTSRHVAAGWTANYNWAKNDNSLKPVPGLVFDLEQEGSATGSEGHQTALKGNAFRGVLKEIPASLERWTPAEARTFGRKPIKGKILDGRNVYFEVTFPKTEVPYNATTVRLSNRHDVALIKIEAPQAITAVQSNDNYDQIQPGDGITIMGYPTMSPDVVVATKSQDPFNHTRQNKAIPDPTVTGGLVGKILREEQSASRREEREYFSEFGDSIQLTANSTGAGNSGGPVFDDHGRVIGIFYAKSTDTQGGMITFAVPIRYGMELMRTSPVMK
ncbi:MAG TPA: trypsin-like peptidase domain-containing protein [Blastocatellia bacterium]|nr:trypsin-like peptidase domain-containing protein [Blastocatellia bacterium]